jgi:hypothetical protein
MSGVTSDMPARIGKFAGATLPAAKPAKRKPAKRKVARKVMTGLINRAG